MCASMFMDIALLILFGIVELIAIDHDDLPVSAKLKVIALEAT